MSRVATAFVIAIAMTTLVSSAAAEQQITIRVVDGRDGEPLKGTMVDLWFGTRAIPPPVQVIAADDGKATVAIPDSVETIVIAAQGVADCRAGKQKSYIEKNVYRVQDILHTGVVAQNVCSKAKDQQTRGVLIFYVRPLHWWEKMHD